MKTVPLIEFVDAAPIADCVKIDEKIIDKMLKIYVAETNIRPDRDLYLITWSPDPKELPDCSFIVQHEYNIDLLVHYLKGVDVGIWTVESTQKGTPHYHGWYQPSDDSKKELLRISVVKTMERFGNLKITKSIGKYKVNVWHTPHCNCLYYYKKDVGGSMMYLDKNPITLETKTDMDFTSLSAVFFTIIGRNTSKHIREKASQREQYKQFYNETVEHYTQYDLYKKS